VIGGKDILTASDIAEVLGPHRREEAEDHFKVLDENENGDIQLEEMVMTVVETGRVRHAIFQNMEDINHAINTFDWVALLAIAATMVFFICECSSD
jgi:Ca2+-binding EF-hand superfamily protein